LILELLRQCGIFYFLFYYILVSSLVQHATFFFGDYTMYIKFS
jgi:hypothetical protein